MNMANPTNVTDDDLISILQSLGVAPQQQQQQAPSAQDFYMQQMQGAQNFDPLSTYNQVTGGASNVKPGYRADDILAWLKFQQDQTGDAAKGYFDAQNDERNFGLNQSKFGLDQDKFSYQQQQDKTEQSLKYGDPDDVADQLALQFGGYDKLANLFEAGNDEATKALQTAMGVTDPDTGAITPAGLTFMHQVYGAAREKETGGAVPGQDNVPGGMNAQGYTTDPTTGSQMNQAGYTKGRTMPEHVAALQGGGKNLGLRQLYEMMNGTGGMIDQNGTATYSTDPSSLTPDYIGNRANTSAMKYKNMGTWEDSAAKSDAKIDPKVQKEQNQAGIKAHQSRFQEYLPAVAPIGHAAMTNAGVGLAAPRALYSAAKWLFGSR
jgi:hypothetical protein